MAHRGFYTPGPSVLPRYLRKSENLKLNLKKLGRKSNDSGTH